MERRVGGATKPERSLRIDHKWAPLFTRAPGDSVAPRAVPRAAIVTSLADSILLTLAMIAFPPKTMPITSSDEIRAEGKQGGELRRGHHRYRLHLASQDGENHGPPRKAGPVR